MNPRAFAAALAGLLLSYASGARAALTTSEKAEVREFFASGQAANAGKTRSLLARTDLTAEETTEALTEAVVPVAFTDARAIFLKELVFGGTSAPSRPVLASATVKALTARADAIHQRYVGGLDHEPKAIAELIAIYGFIDSAIANAGKPTAMQHDGNAGIPVATYEECSKVLRDHVDKNGRWLKGDGAIPETTSGLRAQAQVALIDMLPDGLTRRVDAVDRLQLKGARRTLLVESGVLFADSGKTDDAHIEAARQLLAHLPGVRVDLGVIHVGSGASVIVSRGQVVNVSPAPEPYPFDDPPPGNYDPQTSAIAHELAVVAAGRALDNRWAQLRLQSDRDTVPLNGDRSRMLGKPRAPSVEHVIGAAVHALLVDAPKALDLSVARAVGGRPESIALLSDALGVLAVTAQGEMDPKPGYVGKLELAKPGGWTTASLLRMAPNQTVVGFTLDGHAWSIDRASPSYIIMGVRKDNKAVAVGQLGAMKDVPRDANEWKDSGYVFTKAHGSPRVALAASQAAGAGPNVKLLGGSEGFDAITTNAPNDFVIDGDLFVRDAPGGIAFRAAPTAKGIRGGMLLVTPQGKTALSYFDDGGSETHLAAPIDSPSGPLHVKITVTGKNVEAVVGTMTLKGTLPEAATTGSAALVAKRGAQVEVGAFTIKKKP